MGSTQKLKAQEKIIDKEVMGGTKFVSIYDETMKSQEYMVGLQEVSIAEDHTIIKAHKQGCKKYVKQPAYFRMYACM